jgi:alpha-ketoglutarate-dependent taurine dioxygenase
MGMTGEWLPSGDLKTVTGVLPAVQVDPRTGLKVWFNSVVAAFTGWKDVRNQEGKAVVLGDGRPLDKEAMLACLQIMNEVAVDFPWQKGDVLLIDNKVTMHGRRSFKPPRRILASLAK